MGTGFAMTTLIIYMICNQLIVQNDYGPVYLVGHSL